MEIMNVVSARDVFVSMSVSLIPRKVPGIYNRFLQHKGMQRMQQKREKNQLLSEISNL